MAIIAPRKKMDERAVPMMGGAVAGTGVGPGQSPGVGARQAGTGYVNPSEYTSRWEGESEKLGQRVEDFMQQQFAEAKSALEKRQEEIADQGGLGITQAIGEDPQAEGLGERVSGSLADTYLPTEFRQPGSELAKEMGDVERLAGYAGDQDQWGNILSEMRKQEGRPGAGFGVSALERQLLSQAPGASQMMGQFQQLPGQLEQQMRDYTKQQIGETARERFEDFDLQSLIEAEQQRRDPLIQAAMAAPQQFDIDPSEYLKRSMVTAADVYTPEMRARRQALMDIAGLAGVDLEDVYAAEEYRPDEQFFTLPGYERAIEVARARQAEIEAMQAQEALDQATRAAAARTQALEDVLASFSPDPPPTYADPGRNPNLPPYVEDVGSAQRGIVRTAGDVGAATLGALGKIGGGLGKVGRRLGL